ncbi:MAG: transketolase [Deltaproteobacteria bacterium]|nr:transketolase [Deltaproteobacteria bacterium]
MAALIEELQTRAALLRAHSLRATAQAGSGHPTTCLSAADLVAALFFHTMRYHPEDPGHADNDRFVLSKGHAAPLLYAAWAEAGAFAPERLLTLRRIDSELEGHPTPRFPGTVAATGSLGQGLSVGVGTALALRLDHSPARVYVMLGDGETAEGAVWEAAALAAHYRLDNLVAIVDVNGLGQSQRTMYGFDLEPYRARFEAFGWKALTIDGHDMSAILSALAQAQQVTAQPVAIVARTKKGKGVSFIEDKDGWHGKPLKQGEELERALKEVCANLNGSLGAPAIKRPAPAQPGSAPAIGTVAPPAYTVGDMVATREAYGTALAKLGAAAAHVVVLDADTKNSTFSERFLAAYPERFFENFIAEQNMIGAAVGLAAAGKIPFLSSFACFLTRGFDHLRMAAISQANIKVAGSHCGVSIGEDGPSQMGLEDLAMMRAIPGAVVLYPSDAVCTERLVEAVARRRGMAYLRLSRPKTPVLYGAGEDFPIGGSKVLRSSPHDVVTVITAGVTLFEALKAHEQLQQAGIAIRVIDAYSVRPLDTAGILAAAAATNGRVLTVEDHYYDGGLGDAVLNAVAEADVKVRKLAVRAVPRSGKPEELIAAHGIGASAIAAAVRQMIG